MTLTSEVWSPFNQWASQNASITFEDLAKAPKSPKVIQEVAALLRLNVVHLAAIVFEEDAFLRQARPVAQDESIAIPARQLAVELPHRHAEVPADGDRLLIRDFNDPPAAAAISATAAAEPRKEIRPLRFIAQFNRHSSCRAATPGNSLPSSISSDAPPPLLTCV